MALPSSSDWIASCVKAAQAAHASVPGGCVDKVRTLLVAQLSQRPLKPSEVAELARELIAEAEAGTTEGNAGSAD